jgi:phosphoribosylaminoimidazole-succinocarboxamide synthase
MKKAITEVNLHEVCPEVELISKGKVREVYRLKRDPSKLLLVATDRLSAFDVVMKNGIPDKGKILTQLSTFWFHHVLSDIDILNHLITDKVSEMPEYLHKFDGLLRGRSMLVRSLKMLPIEAVIRGYLTGHAWKEYTRIQSIHGTPFPPGLLESSPFPSPLYTPTTKEPQGFHGKRKHYHKS